MSKITGVLCCVLVFVSVLNAQQDFQIAPDGILGTPILDGAADDVDGSPLAFEKWRSATVIDTDGNTVEVDNLNYNGFTGKMMHQTAEGNYIELDSYKYLKVEFDNELMMNLTPFKGSGFGRVIYDGDKIKFFEQKSARKTTRNTNAYNQVTNMYKLSWKTEQLFFVDNTLYTVKRKEKELARFFDKSTIKKIVKERGLKLSKDEDLFQLLDELEKKP